jgi:serine/threonine-protein kinase
MNNLHQSVVDVVRGRVGTTLRSKWRIDALIGVGGMAAVYAATDTTGARVAIKMLHAALSINDSVRKRFAREGHAANSIGHDGIARVIDDGVAEDGSAFLVMELLEGETAAGRAERLGGKLPVHEVAFIGEAVADVLAAAHAKNIIHRDVKPDNVFLTTRGRVVMLDFGIARVADAAGVSESATRTGTMMGTPAFMPPEQARGRANEMDQASDVWALGATLFWLASGRLVHEAETANEQLVAAATLPAPSLARVMPSAPEPLVVVIDKALEFAKENRFHDAVAMKQALHAAVLAVSWSAMPSLAPYQGDDTVADHKLYTPFAAKLKPAGLDDATTIAQQKSPLAASARAPTIGPVELSRAERPSYLVAIALGTIVGTVVLVLVALIARATRAHEPRTETPVVAAAMSAAPIATPIATPTPIASAPAETATTPTASIAPIASAVPSETPSTRPPTTNAAPMRKSWLDRRK